MDKRIEPDVELEELLGELVGRVTAISWVGADSDFRYDGSGAQAILEHVDAHRDLYLMVISGERGPDARQQMIDTFRAAATRVFLAAAAKGRWPRQPLSLTVTTFVGALLAVIEDWISNDAHPSAAELAATFMQSQVNGIEWALGFEAGGVRYLEAET